MLPHRLGRDIDIREVRAVTDLARAEEWDDILSAVLPSLDKTGLASISDKFGQRIKQVGMSRYIALIGLAGIVGVAAVLGKHRKI